MISGLTLINVAFQPRQNAQNAGEPTQKKFTTSPAANWTGHRLSPSSVRDKNWHQSVVTLWWTYKKLLEMAIYSGFSHEKWWFSIAMLVHQWWTWFSWMFPMGFRQLSHGFLSLAAPNVRTLPWLRMVASSQACCLEYVGIIFLSHDISWHVGCISSFTFG